MASVKTDETSNNSNAADAAARMATTILYGSDEDVKKIFTSEDEDVQKAFTNMGKRVTKLANNQLAWGQQVLEKGRESAILGNLDAGLHVVGRGEQVYRYGRSAIQGGLWVGSKLTQLLG